MARSQVTPNEFIAAWRAEAKEKKAQASVQGVMKRLGGRMSRQACSSRAHTYRTKRNINLKCFQGGNHPYDWDKLSRQNGKATASGTKSKAKPKAKPAKPTKTARSAKVAKQAAKSAKSATKAKPAPRTQPPAAHQAA